MKTALTWILLILMALGGMGGSWAVSDTFRTDARQAWKTEVSQAAQWLSGTVLGWMEESYAPLSGLAILFENSREVTEAEFLGATDALEARATAFFLDAKAIVRQRTDDKKWSVEFSNDPLGPLSPDIPLDKFPVILDTIRVALGNPDQVVLGPPFTGEGDSPYSPAALAVRDATGPLVVIGLVDYDAITKGLFDIHKLDGLQLQIQGRFKTPAGPGEQREVIGQPMPDAVYSVTTRTVSAGADLSITWYANRQFSQGPQETLADFTLIGGIAATILVTLIVGMIMGQNRTITRRIQMATGELTAAEDDLQKLSAAVEQSPASVVITDLGGTIEYVNPKFSEVTGYTAQEAVGRNPRILNSGVNPPEVYEQLWQTITAGGTWRGELLNKKKNDEQYWEAVSISPIKSGDGTISHYLAVKEDITKRKQLEESIREKEARFRGYFEYSQVGMAVTSPTKGWVEANDQLQRMLGYDLDGLRRMTWAELTHPDDLDADVNEFERLLAGEINHYSLDKRFVRKDGEIVSTNLTVSCIQDDAGGVINVLASFQDITERKRMEDDLHERIKELDAAQSAMLNMMEDLDEEKSRAEAATRAKGDFLANMSHEIRTPMNAVIGMAHLALKTELSLKQQDYLNKIQSSANSLLGIINDILDFSKIEAGKLDMEAVELDLSETLDNVANVITVKAQEKEDLEVLFYLDSRVPNFLVGDPLRLNQVLVNLGNNAVKFTEHGEIVLTTKVIERSRENVTLQFSMRDTGIGMSAEQQANLFQAFSQADTSTTRKYGGTGLGLTISKRLVNLMGGKIWVESAPGQGTTFSFTADFGLGKDAVKKRFVPSPDLKDLKVLVVDDNATSRQIFQDILASFSFNVFLAASGEDALKKIDAADGDKPFELVIMDWKMPGMDGIETARQIKNRQGLRRIPAIVLATAYGREEIMQQADEIGLEGYLIKPVGSSMLFDAIMQALGKEIEGGARPVSKMDKVDGNWETLGGIRLLLVEDNEINQQVAKEILEGAGLVVTIANDGKEAVQKVLSSTFEAILMDVQMPVMDGYTACRKIREWESTPDRAMQPPIPIIAMTAHAMAGDEQKSIDAGMNDHVTKPIDPDRLFTALQKWAAPVATQTAVHKKPAPNAPPEPDPAVSREGELPQSLPGFDLAKGLLRLMGNKRLYRKLLLDFGANYTGIAGEIREALAAGDFKQARLLAHTLKGIAGNLEATDLQPAALSVEMLVKGPSKDAVSEKELGPKMKELENALERAFDAVRTLNPAVGERTAADSRVGTKTTVPPEITTSAATRIKAAAELWDVMGITSIAEELKSQYNAMTPFCDELIRLAEDCDFDGIQAFVLKLDG